MAKNYTISFKSLRTGNDYVVTIGGGTDGTVALKGAASPFVTEEGDDEDVFTPVRTQTGYIRIVDDGYGTQIINGKPTQVSFDWKDLIPLTDTARPVTLTQGATVLWQGFMQSQNFGATLYGNPQEREYPIQCPLASAAGQDIVLATSPVTEMKNFAYYLKRILDYIVSVTNGAISFDYVYLQGGSTMQSNMLCLIDPQCFVELDKDENTISAKYNKYDVLEDICRYWGLTARVHGRSVYLCAPNADSTFIKMSASGTNNDLERMAAGTAAGTSVNVQSVTIGNVFASMDNDVTLQRGYSKATVKGDAGNADKEIIECYPDYIIDQMPSAGGATWHHFDWHVMYTKMATSIDGIDMVGAATGDSRFATGQLYENDYNVDAADQNLLYFDSTQYNGNVKLSLETKFEHSFAGMGLELFGDTYFSGHRMEDVSGEHDYGNKTMYVNIGIGKTKNTAVWFTGSGWSSTKTAVQLTICNKSNKLYYLNTYAGINTYETRIEMPNTAERYGKLFIEFLGVTNAIYTDWADWYNFLLVGFKVEMSYNSSIGLVEAGWDKSTKEVSAENNCACVEVWNADCIFCSYGNVKFGYGIYYKSNGQISNTIPNQEFVLANRVCGQTNGYWKSSKLMYRTELLANDQDVAALTPQYEANIDNVACYPVSIGRDWRDDVAKVIFIQK